MALLIGVEFADKRARHQSKITEVFNMSFTIGVTERGDAGRDLGWTSTIQNVDCAILITKTITKDFAQAVLACKKPLIVHCTCTGWGGTDMEPHAFPYWVQLNSLKHLIEAGFPASRTVLRIDPIIPNFGGIEAAERVLQYAYSLGLNKMGLCRIRISVVDDYRHTKERFRQMGWETIYPGDNFQASDEQLKSIIEMLVRNRREKIFFETCAEHKLAQIADDMGYRGLLTEEGCVSLSDLWLMGYDGFSTADFGINPQNRGGCRCLSCKTELLTRKHPCKNGCKYCFWK